MSLRIKMVLAMGITVTIACIFLSLALYQSQRASLLRELDKRLLMAAQCARMMLPDNYHDTIIDHTSVSPDAFRDTVHRHNEMCTRFGMQYLWSCMHTGTQIVFTTSTSPSLDVRNDDHAKFFSVHDDPQAFADAFDTMDVDYSTFHNEWGEGRMVLVPFRDAQGRKCCFGASVSVDDVNHALGETLLQGIVVSLLVICLGVVISFLIAASFVKPIQGVTEAAGRIARGDLQTSVAFGGSQEVTQLSQALNLMIGAIREKITEVEERSEHLRITLNSIGDAVIATDHEGRVQRMNPVAARLTGWSERDAIGRNLADVFQVEDAETGEAVDDPARLVMQTGSTVDLTSDTVLRSRDGKCYRIADSGAPIRSQEGETVGVVLVFRDVSQQRELEQQLRQAQKMDAIGHLAGGIAHDFNNQLSGILGFADVLVETAKDSDTRMCANMILKTAQRAAELTQQLLAFARKGQYQSRPLDIHEAIRGATHLLSRSVDRRIEVRAALVAPQHTVRGDRGQLENALLNLGLNACDAMPEGGVLSFSTDVVHLDEEYCARVAFEVTPGQYLRVSVGDTGQGISPDVLDRIFEPFFTTKGPGEGTGMGLAAVYGAVTQHKGAITVDSRLGQGTTFRVYLPLIHEEVEPEAHCDPDDQVAIMAGKTILFVDDEASLRSLIDQMLRPLGCTTVTAANGEEAISYYRTHSAAVDLVILDLVMPKMNGQQAFNIIRGINPEAKVLIISGYSVDRTAQQLLDAGANGFMQKPFSVRELRETVSRLLRT